MCSDINHPINPLLLNLKSKSEHTVDIVRNKNQLTEGDFLFLISCSEYIDSKLFNTYDNCIVLHASDLPKGRGWSPHIWGLLEGAEYITVSAIDAAVKLDCGDIWFQKSIKIPRHSLWDEINLILFNAEIEIITYIIENHGAIIKKPQDSRVDPTYFRRRNPEDSEINPYQSIQSQFDIIRVADPNRYPAYFKYIGHEYKIILEKINE